MTQIESSLLFCISVGIVTWFISINEWNVSFLVYYPHWAIKISARRENKNLIEIVSIRFYGAAAGARIPDSQIKSLILYQLSYSNMSYTYVSLIYRFLCFRRNNQHCCSRRRRHQTTSQNTHCGYHSCPAKNIKYFTYIDYIVIKSDDFSVFII